MTRKEKIQLSIQIILGIFIMLVWYILVKYKIYFSLLNFQCPFYYITGYYCPGCGGTRAFDAFIHGHWLISIIYHPIVISTFLIYMTGIIGFILYFITKKKKYIFHIGLEKIAYLDFIILAWFIIRNVYIYLT